MYRQKTGNSGFSGDEAGVGVGVKGLTIASPVIIALFYSNSVLVYFLWN